MKVSIIVPVYNAQRFLTECLDSLVNQTLQEIEILAINDGSTDDSLAILSEYQQKYPEKMKVFTTENQGVSMARNFGIEKAIGEYILFVDSDDYIDLAMCEIMYGKATKDNNDVVICNRYDIKKTLNEIDITPVSQNFRLQDRPFEMANVSPFPWDKLYRASFIKDHPFEAGIRFEDLLFVHTLMPKATSIGVVRKPLYYYRKLNDGGFLNGFSKATFDIVFVFEKLVAAYKENGWYEVFEEELEYLSARHIFLRFDQMLRKKKIGSYQDKRDLIRKGHEFLRENFPNWEQNHFVKYSTLRHTRLHIWYYKNERRLSGRVWRGHYLPGFLTDIEEVSYRVIRRLIG